MRSSSASSSRLDQREYLPGTVELWRPGHHAGAALVGPGRSEALSADWRAAIETVAG